MKKIMFVIRDGFDARLICSKLNYDRSRYKVFYVIESGAAARRKKARRMFQKRKNPGAVFLDMCCLYFYDKIMLAKMKKLCGKQSYPAGEAYPMISDVNEKKSLEICHAISPDIIMIYGSGILSARTIRSFGSPIYNIHSSILPYYRNVHSDFWAYMNEDYDKIGITIFQLERGIDTGNIAVQMPCGLSKEAGLAEHKVRNLYHIVEIVPRFWDDYFENRVSLAVQDESASSVSRTPGASDFMRFLRKRRMT